LSRSLDDNPTFPRRYSQDSAAQFLALPVEHMKASFKSKPAAARSRSKSKAADPLWRAAALPNERREQLRRDNAMDPRKAQKSYEAYLALARAEELRGDPIAAENYLQHAEHYFRSMRAG